jgi:hypothetical protein
MPHTPTPRRRTRASNRLAHPGNVDKGKERLTPSQAQKIRKAKAQAKAAREEARENNVNRIAEFERDDMLEEHLNAATPRAPVFTPKPTHERRFSDLTPLPAPEMNDVASSDATNETSSFVQPPSEDTADEPGESAAESNEPTPFKKRKVTKKGAEKMGVHDSAPNVNSKVMPFSSW